MSVWRLIRDISLNGVENMAVDEALLCAANSVGSSAQPVLRLYGWSEPTISIGRLQDEDRYAEYGLPVVRRVTGGRAVVHFSEITYSIVAPADHELFDQGIMGAYYRISLCIVAALKDFGVDAQMTRTVPSERSMGKLACFFAPSRHEVTINDRKLVGSAQRRLRKAFLQHGSILTGFDAELNARVFGPGLIERVTWLSAHTQFVPDEFKGRLVSAFSDGLNAQFKADTLSAAEESIKNSLLEGFAETPSKRLMIRQMK